MCQGPLTVSAAGRVSAPFGYDYQTLVTVPDVTDVHPTVGPTVGGTLVTVIGAGFQASGTVTFVAADNSTVGACDWQQPDGLYTATEIR